MSLPPYQYQHHSAPDDDSTPATGYYATMRGDINTPAGEVEWDPEALGQALLNDDSNTDWSAVTNLDAFFCKVYTYYVEKGFCTLAFTICFSSFLLLFVNWHSILFCDSNCDDIVGFRSDAFSNPSTLEYLVFTYFGVFCVYWLWNLLSFFYTLRDALEMRSFYQEDLEIQDDDLVSLEWHYILESLVQVSARKKLCIVKDLSALDITNRIMRKENFMIAMINLDLFQFGAHDSLGRCNIAPYCCPSIRRRQPPRVIEEMKQQQQQQRKVLRERTKTTTATTNTAQAKAMKNPLIDAHAHASNALHVNSSAPSSSSYSTFSSPPSSGPSRSSAAPGSFLSGRPRHSWWSWAVMGTTLEWNLKFAVLHSLFDHHFSIHSSYLGSAGISSLRRRFRILGVANLLLTPFIMLFMIIFFFLKHAEELHSKKSLFGPRQWCNLAQWKLREFNELPHFFERRLTLSAVAAQQYMQQFPNTLVSIIAQSIAYITGALVAILLLLTVTDSDIITHRIWDRTLLWYLAVFSGILALSRSMIPDKTIYPAPALVMQEVVKHTHYSPAHWRHRTHTSAVHQEFAYMYPSRLSMFCYEIMSVIMTPFVLMFCLPHSAEKIVQFVSTRTINVQGVGHLCSYAMFDLDKHGDARYSSLTGASVIVAPDPSSSASDARPSVSTHAGGVGGLSLQRQASGGPHAVGVAPFPLRLKHGKMEKSFLGFSMANPHWKPLATDDGGSGKRFLEGLAETMYGGGGGVLTPLAMSREVSGEMRRIRPSASMAASKHTPHPTIHSQSANQPMTGSVRFSLAGHSSKLPAATPHAIRQDSLDSNTTEEDGFEEEEADHTHADAGGEIDHSKASYLLSQSDRHLIQSFADLIGMDPSMQSTLHPSTMMRQSSFGSVTGGGGTGSMIGMSTMLGLNSRRPQPNQAQHRAMQQSQMYRPQGGTMYGGFGTGGSLYNPSNSVLLHSSVVGPSRGGLQGGLSASTLLQLDPQALREGLMLSQADQQADLFALMEKRIEQDEEENGRLEEGDEYEDDNSNNNSASEPEPDDDDPRPNVSSSPPPPPFHTNRTFVQPTAASASSSSVQDQEAIWQQPLLNQQEQLQTSQQATPTQPMHEDDNEPPPMSFFN